MIVVVIVIVAAVKTLYSVTTQNILEVPHRLSSNYICKTQLEWSVYTTSVGHALITKKPSSGVSCSSHGFPCVTHTWQFGAHNTMSSYVAQCVHIWFSCRAKNRPLSNKSYFILCTQDSLKYFFKNSLWSWLFLFTAETCFCSWHSNCNLFYYTWRCPIRIVIWTKYLVTL